MDIRIIFFLVLIFLISGCSNPETEPDKVVFATEADLIGFWKLNSVLLNDVEVTFDNYKPLVSKEYFAFSANNRVHHIEYFTYPIANNIEWKLNEDLLTIKSTYERIYKIQSFSNSQLVISPNSRQNLKLEFTSLSEAEFPEVSFNAEIDGVKVQSTSASATLYGSTMYATGSSDSFFMSVSLPSDATAGQEFSHADTGNPFTALVKKNDTDYGWLEEGNIQIVKKSVDYIHIKFSFKVRKNSGNEIIEVTDGNIRTMISE